MDDSQVDAIIDMLKDIENRLKESTDELNTTLKNISDNIYSIAKSLQEQNDRAMNKPR
jgi:uncharacterized protein YukE